MGGVRLFGRGRLGGVAVTSERILARIGLKAAPPSILWSTDTPALTSIRFTSLSPWYVATSPESVNAGAVGLDPANMYRPRMFVLASDTI